MNVGDLIGGDEIQNYPWARVSRCWLYAKKAGNKEKMGRASMLVEGALMRFVSLD